jgi:hypothetical protein
MLIQIEIFGRPVDFVNLSDRRVALPLAGRFDGVESARLRRLDKFVRGDPRELLIRAERSEDSTTNALSLNVEIDDPLAAFRFVELLFREWHCLCFLGSGLMVARHLLMIQL